MEVSWIVGVFVESMSHTKVVLQTLVRVVRHKQWVWELEAQSLFVTQAFELALISPNA